MNSEKLVHLGAVVIIIIGGFAVLGHSLHNRFMSDWSGHSQMAVPTAISLMITGACLWALANKR